MRIREITMAKNDGSSGFFHLFLWVLILITLSVSVSSCLRIGPERVLPQIQIKQWQEVGEFEWKEPRAQDGALNSDLLSIVNGSVFVFTQDITAVIISCDAPYPIEWTTNLGTRFPPNALYLMRGHSSRYSDDIFIESSFSYSHELFVRGQLRDFTGNYTCQKVGDSNVATSRYIFWEGLPPPFLILNNQTTTVEITGSESSVTLPCFVSTPDANVFLFKSISNMFYIEDFIPVAFNDSIQFDPKVGITMDLKSMPYPEGKYKCVTNDTKDFVLVEIVRTLTPSKPRDFGNQDIISKGSQFSYEEKTSSLICCSPGKSPPTINFQFCLDPTVCKFMEDLRPDDKASNGTRKKIPTSPFVYMKRWSNGTCTHQQLIGGMVGHFQCQGEGINVIRTLYTSLQSPPNKTFNVYTSWDGIKPQELIAITVNEIDYSSSFYDRRPGGGWRRGGGRGRGWRGGKGGNKPGKGGRKNGWRSGRRVSNNYKFRSRPRMNNNGKMPKHIYDGELLNFTCKASVNYFASGSRFVIRWKNKTITQIQPEDVDPKLGAREMHSFERITKASVNLIEMDVDMDAIICYAAVFNSSKWIQKELKLNVQAPITPIITSGPDEVIYWTLNDTNKVLKCSADGEPKPAVMFLIDGKEISNSSWTVLEKGNSSLVMKIPLVSHETHGEYTCVATNLAGTAQQKVNLIVEDATHWTSIIVVIVVTTILLMVLILVGWKFQLQKKILSRLAGNPILGDSD